MTTNEGVAIVIFVVATMLIVAWQLQVQIHDLQRQITHTRNAVNQLLDQIEEARNDHK